MSEKIENSSETLDAKIAKECTMDEPRGEFEKWNKLPPEIKMMVIKRMDLKPRTLLRRTSRTEKSLVDMLIVREYKLDYVSFDDGIIVLKNDVETIEIRRNNKTEEEYLNMVASFFEQVFKKAEVKVINIFDLPKLETLDVIIPPNSFKIHELAIHCPNRAVSKTALWFLEKTWSNIENLHIGRTFGYIFINAYEATQSLNTVRKMFSIFANDHYTVYNGILQWSNSEHEIGSKIRISKYEYREDFISVERLFAMLDDQFGDRIISWIDLTPRLTTNNPQKHILIHFDCIEHPDFPCFCGVVIPADIPDSEVQEYLDFHLIYE
uniref:F-box domain-containing protein n=1 Tax=Caenorhabditis tropicalis TaxID=1561998 RepID=A0A1I7TS52_9PELO